MVENNEIMKKENYNKINKNLIKLYYINERIFEYVFDMH